MTKVKRLHRVTYAIGTVCLSERDWMVSNDCRGFRKAKSIDEIYREIIPEGYRPGNPLDTDKMVICCDPALVKALNTRYAGEKISLGRLAYSPEDLALKVSHLVGDGDFPDEQQVVDGIRKELGGKCSFSFVMGELTYIRTLLRNLGGDAEAFKDEFLFSDESKRILDEFLEMNTPEKTMRYSVSPEVLNKDGKEIIFLGREHLDALQKGFLAEIKGREVDLFRQEECRLRHLENMYIVGNNQQIAECALSRVTEDNADNVALVLDTSGELMGAVRSELYRRGIPFELDQSATRDYVIELYLSIIENSLKFEYLRLQEVRGLLSELGIMVDEKDGEYLISKYPETHLPTNEDRKRIAKEMINILRTAKDSTFSGTCSMFESFLETNGIKIADCTGRYSKTLSKVLKSTGMGKRVCSEENLSELRCRLSILNSSATAPRGCESKGVLILGCGSMYIDRQYVMFLELGSEWSPDIAEKRYIRDKKAFGDLDAERFSILIQQGSAERAYIVRGKTKGDDSIPCTYFRNMIMDPEKKMRFQDLSGDGTQPWNLHPIERLPLEIKLPHQERSDETLARMFSKSSYSRYKGCIYRGLYHGLYAEPDSVYNLMGSYIHAFAEAYIHGDRRSEGDWTNRIMSDISPLVGPESARYIERRIRKNVRNIMAFLDRHADEVVALPPTGTNKGEYLGDYPDTWITEHDLVSAILPIHGEIDLLLGKDIWDYKTGKMVKPRTNKRELIETFFNDDYQSVIYLALLHEIYPGEEISFNWYYSSMNTQFPPSDNDLEDCCIHFRIVDPERIINHIRETGDWSIYFGKDGFKKHDDPVKNRALTEFQLGAVSDYFRVAKEYGSQDGQPEYTMDEDMYQDLIGKLDGLGLKSLSTYRNYVDDTFFNRFWKVRNNIVHTRENEYMLPMYAFDNSVSRFLVQTLAKDHEDLNNLITDGYCHTMKIGKCEDCKMKSVCLGRFQ